MAKTFSRLPYMPILRWMASEKDALIDLSNDLSADLQSSFLPLLELRDPNKLNSLLTDCHWGSYFVEIRNNQGRLPEWGANTFLNLLPSIEASKGRRCLVINPLDADVIAQTLRQNRTKPPHQYIFRFRTQDFLSQNEIANILHCKALLDSQCTALIIDLRSVTALDQAAKDQLVNGIIHLEQHIPHIWVSSGAYPNGYKNIDVGLNIVSRADWGLWQDLNKKHPGRIGFSDYAVVSPEWQKATGGGGGVPTAYRYAHDKNWLIYKGDSNKGAASISIANLLVNRAEFKGHDFSTADNTIKTRSDTGLGPGGPQQHIREGINHHVVLVLKEQYSCSPIGGGERGG